MNFTRMFALASYRRFAARARLATRTGPVLVGGLRSPSTNCLSTVALLRSSFLDAYSRVMRERSFFRSYSFCRASWAASPESSFRYRSRNFSHCSGCVIPLAQLVRRREVSQPRIERGRLLRQAPRPESVHQHASAILPRSFLIHALEGDRHTRCILTLPEPHCRLQVLRADRHLKGCV